MVCSFNGADLDDNHLAKAFRMENLCNKIRSETVVKRIIIVSMKYGSLAMGRLGDLKGLAVAIFDLITQLVSSDNSFSMWLKTFQREPLHHTLKETFT